jgi:hypothetical protein
MGRWRGVAFLLAPFDNGVVTSIRKQVMASAFVSVNAVLVTGWQTTWSK